MTIYIQIQEDPRFSGERNFYWRSGYIDLSHFKFREVREFLQKYELSRHFDEVIFFSVDNNGLDSATLAKLEFYIDKLAKSSAAKARHQSVAIVTVGTSGIKSLLPRLIKSYTGSKGVQITTIAVSPFAYSGAEPQTRPQTSETGLDYHVLSGSPIANKRLDSGRSKWGSETNAVFEILSDLVSKTGHLTCIYANDGFAVLKEFGFVPKAVAMNIDVTAIILTGLSKYSNAILEILSGKSLSDIKIDEDELKQLGHEASINFNFEDLSKVANRFLAHTLAGSLPGKAKI